MRLDSLKHLARAANGLAETKRLVVFGSASLLATFPELGDDYGGPLSKTFDANFVPEPWDDEMAHLLHVTLGKNEDFHIHFGYYADIIRPVVFEQFPKGWEDRLVPVPGVERALCLDPHDMAAAKCQAGRPKDIELLVLLFETGRLVPDLVRERLREVPMREAAIVASHRVLDEAIRRAGEAH
ncbi:hypothetical protein OKA05_25375 [Luteolibacter arcticus]|uniref:Uncharacterized protein n=1 Tax=Luteolibacter arcticus TaxID=1581411 RepID=A0ABT3GQW3_9BACT|nr:DUF6036 family nucleotidyltransferase [Luteolibacter arcticus]MCW1925915.1 hypothetical protein [Luteolibacter arcticus]